MGIAHRHAEDQRWHADMAQADLRSIGRAASADGKRVFWMKLGGPMPEPVVQNFGDVKIDKLNIGPGLWAAPAWR